MSVAASIRYTAGGQAWKLPRTRLATKAGHVRLILCLPQALQELQALGFDSLGRLCIRIRLDLCASDPLSASAFSAISHGRVFSRRACMAGGARGVAGRLEGPGGGDVLLVDPPGVALLVHERHAALQPPRLTPSPDHRRPCNYHPYRLHIPALSGASQGDRRCRPWLRSRLCAWPRSPFRVSLRSRSRFKWIPRILDA